MMLSSVKQVVTINKTIAVLLTGLLLASCGPRFEAEITPGEIGGHIQYLASDELAGRYPGTPGDDLLETYITDAYRKCGLRLYEKTGLQSFPLITEIEAGPGNRLEFGEEEFSIGKEFMPFSFSASTSLSAELAFAAYGLQVDQDSLHWNDYADIDVNGKWVMILRGVPGAQEASSPFTNFSEDRGKALVASDMGASGVIFVSGMDYDPDDALVELRGKQHALSIPVIHLTRTAADQILIAAGRDSLAVLDASITAGEPSASFATGVKLSATVDLRPKEVETSNTIAFLKGSDPRLRNEYVIIGAHHDHLGMGGPGTSSRDPDTVAIHYGADDNASGVSGVIEIAENMVARAPARSMVFTTFGAEEMGVVGSRYMTEHPPVDLSGVQAMINLDMIGRLNSENQLQIGGVGTSPGFRSLLDSLNREYGFSLKYANEGYGPSDHSSFYAKDIPVLFISTGAHPDYHTPGDNAASINLEGAARVMDFVADVAAYLANREERIAFTEAGPKVRGSSKGRYGGITLGLMPDVTYDGSEGMPVMFVTEGKPAAVGGIQEGDLITAIEGKSVGNVYDYMERLSFLKEGMDIVVTVKRNGDLLDLVIRI
jgi:aminopeptidase YwaD